MEINQHWTKHAPALPVSAACVHCTITTASPTWAWHDVGAANAQLTAQATTMGLVVHQMAGHDSDEVRALYVMEPILDPVMPLVLGYMPDHFDTPEWCHPGDHWVRYKETTGQLLHKWEHPA
ncbi:MAG: hypothetical protein H7839_20400 [Magnetococcus sp. YQC-5]